MDLRRDLATLLVHALEVGAAKREWDVVDELFRIFGLDFEAIEADVRTEFGGRPGLEALRAAAAERLAAAAPSAAAVMNAIIRSGSRFLAMVDDIYARLTSQATTTTGTSQTFRLQRAGLDEEGLTISPAFLEQIRRLQRSFETIEIGRIDDAALSQFVVWDNGELYGRWPLGDYDNGLRLADAVLHLGWLPGGPDVDAARAAAERLVAAAERLVRAHIAHLDRYDENGTADAAPTLFRGDRPDGWQERFDSELRQFRADGVLGATAVDNVLANLEGRNDVGLDRDLAPVASPSSGYREGTGVSALAGFVAQWRLGLWARRRRDELVLQFEDDPSARAAWLERVTKASGGAATWLERDVLVPTGTAEVVLPVEILEEFLNLPLWRKRDLLYEVWVLCATLEASEQAGWTARLELTTSEGVWTLSTGPTANPVARLDASPSLSLEVWREPKRAQDGAILTPDLTVATPGDLARDLLVVEAKDRWRMPSGQTADKRVREKDTALWAARRYAAALMPAATWVCNYCGFGEQIDPAVNHGDPWTQVHLAGEFRPGEVPAAFADSVQAALTPAAPTSTPLTVVVDMTASMTDHLPTAWSTVTDRHAWAGYREYRAVIYRDHDVDDSAEDPFVVRTLGPFPDVTGLLAAVSALTPDGGGDHPEALEDAMRQCRIIAGEVGAHPVVVLTDAPPHPPTDCPDGISFAAEVDALLAAGCPLHVATDWLDPTDGTWSPFIDHPGFHAAPLAALTTLTATPAPAERAAGGR